MGKLGDVVTRRRAQQEPASRRAALLCGLVLPLALLGTLTSGVLAPAHAQAQAQAHTSASDGTTVHLVTLEGPGVAGYRGSATVEARRQALRDVQDDVLADLGAATPVYRWTTALNGFAVALTPADAERLRGDHRVQLVEENAVRRLAGGAPPASAAGPTRTARGGAGVVVGVIDTGIWPESSLFASVPGLGRKPTGFRGACDAGAAWGADTCNDKLVGAQWFVAGFGADNVRSTSSMSPRDDSGHGTQMASIAAGNSGVSVEVPGLRLRSYSGVAPQARISVYTACWTAPDPADDGCATADLVTAIDRATRDGVDVLSLSVGGPSDLDTVERALLGAAERDIVVVAAAGNAGSTAYAAHASPWVTSVGGVTSDQRQGRVDVPGGPVLTGAMASARGVGPAPLVVAGDVAADGASREAARTCRPGSLDASRTAGAIVLCERGVIGRVVKSDAVERADGVGMVLVNVRPGSVEADLHSVPTVHLDRAAAGDLRRWYADHPRARLRLAPLGVRETPARVTPWSSSGDPTAILVKPDVVGPGVGVLGAVPPGARSTRWDFVSGTSAATAWTTGQALRVRARHDWTADRVRSALATTAASVRAGSLLEQGAGQPDADRADRPGLGYLVEPGDYRDWLEGRLPSRDLNAPSLLLAGDGSSARRTITNVGARTRSFSARVEGFTVHEVTVTPSTVRLAPGESATFEVTISGHTGAEPLDDGWLTWVGPGTRTRIPVVLSR